MELAERRKMYWSQIPIRLFKAAATFLLVITVVPIAAWAAYQAFKDNEAPWE